MAVVTYKLPADLDRALDTRTFPGMEMNESRVMRAFLFHRHREYDEIRFDERLGKGVELVTAASEEDRRNWERLTRARPDAIAWKDPDRASIVEAKIQATLEAIWQVLTYRELYATTFQSHQVDAVIIAESAMPNAIALARTQSIRMYLYTPAAAAPLAPAPELLA